MGVIIQHYGAGFNCQVVARLTFPAFADVLLILAAGGGTPAWG